MTNTNPAAAAAAPTAYEIRMSRVPVPGTHVVHEESAPAWGCAGGGRWLARWYVVTEAADPRVGPYFAATYYPPQLRAGDAPKPVRRHLTVAIDGSWRDASTLAIVGIDGSDVR